MIIDTQKAKEIAKKLKADIVPGTRHDMAVIYEDGVVVAKYGIRRSSRSIGHDHVPKQLYITPRQARQLAQCPLKRHHWIAILRRQNLL